MTQGATIEPSRPLHDEYRRKRSVLEQTRRRAVILFLLLPSSIGVIGLFLLPVIAVVFISFTKWDLFTPPSFVGLGNYKTIFADGHFVHSLLVTAYYVLLAVPLQVAVSLGLAVLVNRSLPGTGFVKVLWVLPWLATPVAMAVVWTWFFDPDPHFGVVNALLGLLGVTGPAWLSSSNLALPVIAATHIWQHAGYSMLFFIAGLSSIPKQLYESAAVDGASGIQQFFRITLPLLNPTMMFVLVTGVIGSFQVFDTVYVLTGGGPGQSTKVANIAIYQESFTSFHFGQGAAMSVIMFLVILLFTGVQFAFFRNRTTYEMV